MNNKDNSKVPIAILSCFLIAFILQGILKISGVFIFEKALDWEIFKIIDSNVWTQIFYYSLLNALAVYCLSFAFTKNPYSKRWWHYIVILIISYSITSLRYIITNTTKLHYLYDVVLYIITPIFINLTTNKDDRAFKTLNINSIINIISLQILLYFCYLGLCYWSSLLSSIVVTNPLFYPASTTFLISFELYLGLILLMLSTNNIIRLKGEIV